MLVVACLCIAKPEVTVTQLTSNHEFIVLACDGKSVVWGVAVTHVVTGIWDVMTNEEVVEFVRSAIAEGTLPDTVSLCCTIRVFHCVCQLFRFVRN